MRGVSRPMNQVWNTGMIRPVRPLIRAAWRLVLWSFVILAQMPAAQAHMMCMKIDQLNSAAEDPVRRKINEHLAARYTTGDTGIFQLTEQYFIAQPAQSSCVDYPCRYLLLQIRDGNVEEKLAFAGTGWIWLFASPQETYQPQFRSLYSAFVVESPERAFVRIGLPRSSGPISVEAWPSDAKIPRCNKPDN
jgi:hypothetical protein